MLYYFFMSFKSAYFIILVYILFFTSCRNQEKKESHLPTNTLFHLLDSSSTGIHFTNTVTDTKDFNILSYRNFYNGGGVAVGDINNDSLPDLFFTLNTASEKLYLNKGNLKFEDISKSAGIEGKDSWTTGVAMADINGDGWQDIYVCYSGDEAGKNRENELFINQKNNTFVERAKEYGLNDKGFTTHAAFFDYDRDGDLDCFMLNNSFKDIRKFDARTDSREKRDSLGGQRLYKNENGKFKDVSEEAGIYGSKIGFGLGVSISDLNEDGWPDMYISNDFFERDYLYINQGNGKFNEELPAHMPHTSMFSMGSDIGDIDNDGRPDIFSTDMLPDDMRRVKLLSRFDEFNTETMRFASNFHNQYMQNCLQWNRGNMKFSEIACLTGVEATDWSWGALILDVNNDGRQDLFVSNGIYKDITNMDFSDFLADKANVDKVVLEKGSFDFRDFLPFIPSNPIPNQLFINRGNLEFDDQAGTLGVGQPSFSNGAAYGDLDKDGDLELIMNNINSAPFIYENTSKSNYISFSLQITTGNTSAIGSKVKVYTNENKQVKELFTNRGFQSTVDTKIIFGLGNQSSVDSVHIVWPDNTSIKINNPGINQNHLVIYTSSLTKKNTAQSASNIQKAENLIVGNGKHKEDNYIDFHAERLIPNMLSTQGPHIAVGDINGDALDDLIMSGAKNDYTKVYIQHKSGKLIESYQRELAADSIFEDTDLLLYDHDGDADLDVLIGSGGNEYPEGTEALSARLYLNDGKGNFTGNPVLSPAVNTNVSCLRLREAINTPTLLFIGGRSVSRKYGLNPSSYLMMNISGRWTDITPDFMKRIGMVTDAAWTDYNKDGKMDLILVGEWMPVTFIKNDGKKLVPDFEVKNSSGWWNTICKTDINSDGFEDYILGNAGLNTRFEASVDHMLQLDINDFDKNQTIDPIISMYNKTDGKSYPFNSRIEMVTQMPSLKKSILKYQDYASRSYEDLFSSEQRKNGVHKEIKTLESSYILNEKGIQFTMKSLPRTCQVSPIYSIHTLAKPNEYFLNGNFYRAKPELGRYDASYGCLLQFDTMSQQFKTIENSRTGLYIEGEVRDVQAIQIGKQNYMVIACNNSHLQFYKTD